MNKWLKMKNRHNIERKSKKKYIISNFKMMQKIKFNKLLRE